MRSAILAAGLLATAMPAMASETSDAIVAAAYEGRLGAERATFAASCEEGVAEACFGAGLGEIIFAYETMSTAFYRHGAVMPVDSPAAMFLGFGVFGTEEPSPLNPEPEPLDYGGFRTILDGVVTSLDIARDYFEQGGEPDDYVVMLDPLRIRLDVNGDGDVGEDETFGPFFTDMFFLPDATLSEKQRSKGVAGEESGIGFDRADALWFAGYTQVTAAPLDWLLAHDFSNFFNAYFHHVFPAAGLPMQDFSRGGVLFLDGDSDVGIADMIAAIHTLSFPVEDKARLALVLERLKAVPELSRRNWDAILAETDDNRELVPSPSQTSLVPDQAVTEEVVAAWMETLDSVEQILNGELLIPHWRFSQGFDLAAYFETASETDLVLLLTGQWAFPFLRDGPIADAESFAAGNDVFGDNWPNFILWFN